MLSRSAAMGYAEIAEGGYRSPLWGAFAEIRDPRFVPVSMQERKDVLTALRQFFRASDPG